MKRTTTFADRLKQYRDIEDKTLKELEHATGVPAQYVEYYDVPVRKREALTSSEIEELLEAAKGTRAELAIHLALYCGLRRGEIVALKWSDIDMNKQVVNITKSVEFIGNQPVEKEPKSKARY